MKKFTIIIGIIIGYTILGIILFRDVVDTEIGFDQAFINDSHWLIGKTIDGSYHYGEVVVTENDTEVFRYQTHYQNSLYRDIIVDYNTVYILGYQFTKDNIVQTCFITAISTDYTVVNEVEININGEIYPRTLQTSNDAVYLVASFSGNKLNDETIINDGEYDIVIITLTKDLNIQSTHTYGDVLSDLVSDAIIQGDELIVSYNYFDSLVSGNVEENNNGKLLAFHLDTEEFTEIETPFSITKSRIQGLVVTGDSYIYYGNVLDNGTSLMTPYFYNVGTEEYILIENLEVNASFVDAEILGAQLVFLLDLEHLVLSDEYGEITRDSYLIYDFSTIEIINIDEDIYIEQITSFNTHLYVVGYQIEKHILKADRTQYYYEQLDF